jgi:predicted MFS family arabinose efflux permease
VKLRRGKYDVGPVFRRLLTAYAIQTFGEGVVLAALPLLAASITTDARLVSIIALMLELPWLLLALPLGVVIDRLNRRRIILGTQALQALALALVATSVLFGQTHLIVLYVLAFVIGTGDILFMGASKAIIPRVVPLDALESANGMNVTAETIGRMFAGPALGAVMFAAASQLPFWIDAVTYLASVLLVRTVVDKGQFVAPQTLDAGAADANAGRPGRRMAAEIGEGASWLLHNPVLRIIVIMAAISNFSVFMAQSTLVLFATENLGLSDSGYGLLVASMAVGGVVGGLLSGRIARRYGPRLLIPSVAAASAVSLVLIGTLGRTAWLVGLMFCAWSFGLSIWNVVAQSLSQRLIPNGLMGRVGGASRMLAFGALPLGALAGGFVGHWLGLRAVWVVGGLIHLAATAVATPVVLRWTPDMLKAPLDAPVVGSTGEEPRAGEEPGAAGEPWATDTPESVEEYT